jgi:hypothetical protein
MSSVKFNLDKEVRRASYCHTKEDPLTFGTLKTMALKLFQTLEGKDFKLCYRDDENDLVTFSSDEELNEAIKSMLPKSTTLKFAIVLGETVTNNSTTNTEGGVKKNSGVETQNCSSLKNALLCATKEDGFLCLTGESFPVSIKESTNIIPSKLLIRDFHAEIKLILTELRERRKAFGNNGGAVFFGPSGTGKSWASMATLVDELLDAFGTKESSHKAVVYFDAYGQRAFVFSDRNVIIPSISSPNEIAIPELLKKSTVLIYDAVRGAQAPMAGFPCEILIFSSPNAGNFKQLVDNNGLERFVCPNWTKDELRQLAHGYGDLIPPHEVDRRFERFGGSPRAVVANPPSISESKVSDASIILKGVKLWSDFSAMNEDWPSSLLKAKYATNEIAKTSVDAYEKYLELNVLWDYSCDRAKDMVHSKYDQVESIIQLGFEKWLKGEKKAAALYGYFFEYKARLLFESTKEDNIEYSALSSNLGLSEEQQKAVDSVLLKASRNLKWHYPRIQKVETMTMDNVPQEDLIGELKKLTDCTVMYRLPAQFPLIDFFNPPNNCFSLGVGNHQIKLNPALKLCKTLPSKQINFIYVTPTENYKNIKYWQSFQQGKQATIFGKLAPCDMKALSRMVQFCMRFRKF